VLESDSLKRRDRTSDCYHQMCFLGSNATKKEGLGELIALDLRGPLRLLMLIKLVPVCFNLVLLIYPSHGT